MDISGKLKRISAGTYKDDRGDVWRLVPVDRNYQCKNKPVYYLQKIENNTANILSAIIFYFLQVIYGLIFALIVSIDRH